MTPTRFLLLGGAAILTLAVAATCVFDRAVGSKPYAEPAEPRRSRAEVLAACDVHVRAAEREAMAAIEHRAAEFASFVDGRKDGAAAFSRDIVSLYGKWRALKPYLPFTDPDGHREYIEKQFAEHIFSTDEVAGAAELAITGSLKDLEAIENQLAVEIQAEISGGSLNVVDVPVATADFSAAIGRVVSAAQWDVAKTGGSLVVSEAAALVGRRVLLRLGVSAGILSTSAASSVWTLGATLIIGLLADMIWQWIDDPAGDIERETAAALEQLAASGSQAIRGEMSVVVAQRQEVWARAVEEMVP